jgi:hypothetical protein
VRAFWAGQGKVSSNFIVILSHYRFSIALLNKPLRIGKLGDLVRVEADFPQLLVRERRLVRRLSAG